MSTNTITIIVPGEARGKGRPRFAKRGNFVKTYTDDKTLSYENLVAYAGAQAMAGRAPLSCPVSVNLSVTTVPPASWSKKKQHLALLGGVFPATKPDADNIQKIIYDALNGIVWLDDKQIVTVIYKKRYSEFPGVVLDVEEAVA